MSKIFRFIYLNIYSFLLLILGLLILGIPFYRLSIFLVILQIVISIFFLKNGISLLSSWKDKKRKYEILIGKNSKEFFPETFKIFMEAPCGRLIVKAVLKDLNKKKAYRELLKYKEPLLVSIKKNLTPVKTKVYINEA